jgi:acyl carrier protein
MTQQDFKEALACKLKGTWNLHHAAERTDARLDFFTMLSSISAIVGTSGQANYASGCAFQDAFALYRQSLGLAAHTVNLGIVEDVGYLSHHQELSDRIQRRSGLKGINEKHLHEILRLSILKQVNGRHGTSTTQMITGLPYPLPDDSVLATDSRFQSLLVTQSSHGNSGVTYRDIDDASVFRAMVKVSGPAERLAAEAMKLVNKQIVVALGLTTDVEESKPLSSYGIDSLAAVDLRNWLRVHLGAELTTLDILNAANLRSLALKVIEKLVDKQTAGFPGKVE